MKQHLNHHQRSCMCVVFMCCVRKTKFWIWYLMFDVSLTFVAISFWAFHISSLRIANKFRSATIKNEPIPSSRDSWQTPHAPTKQKYQDHFCISFCGFFMLYAPRFVVPRNKSSITEFSDPNEYFIAFTINILLMNILLRYVDSMWDTIVTINRVIVVDE